MNRQEEKFIKTRRVWIVVERIISRNNDVDLAQGTRLRYLPKDIAQVARGNADTEYSISLSSKTRAGGGWGQLKNKQKKKDQLGTSRKSKKAAQ